MWLIESCNLTPCHGWGYTVPLCFYSPTDIWVVHFGLLNLLAFLSLAHSIFILFYLWMLHGSLCWLLLMNSTWVLIALSTSWCHSQHQLKTTKPWGAGSWGLLPSPCILWLHILIVICLTCDSQSSSSRSQWSLSCWKLSILSIIVNPATVGSMVID
jgi:hypothetical protein